jgi:hypothetical protein
VFTSIAGRIYVGGQEITGQTRQILRDEAEYIGKSIFWETFNAAIIDEAAKMALTAVMPQETAQVQKAQMLKAWAFRFNEQIKLLTV